MKVGTIQTKEGSSEGHEHDQIETTHVDDGKGFTFWEVGNYYYLLIICCDGICIT